MKKKIVILLAAVCMLLAICAFKDSQSSYLSDSMDDIAGKPMTIEDVYALSAKGSSLSFPDFAAYRGMNLSSQLSGCLMVYGVDGGYRLIVVPEADNKAIRRVDFESIWESGGSGIDIRYDDVDEFIRRTPSHAALTVEEMKAAAQAYLKREVTHLAPDWWEYADTFPNHCKDPAKQTIRDSLDRIAEPLELFQDENGMLIAVSRRSGAVYSYAADENGSPVWTACA